MLDICPLTATLAGRSSSIRPVVHDSAATAPQFLAALTLQLSQRVVYPVTGFLQEVQSPASLRRCCLSWSAVFVLFLCIFSFALAAFLRLLGEFFEAVFALGVGLSQFWCSKCIGLVLSGAVAYLFLGCCVSAFPSSLCFCRSHLSFNQANQEGRRPGMRPLIRFWPQDHRTGISLRS